MVTKRNIVQKTMGIFLFIFMSVSPAMAEESSVLLFPFQINAEKNLNYLQNGVRDILSGRLSTVEEKTINFGGMAGDNQQILQVSREAGAAYSVTGSITVFGSKIITNGWLYRVKDGKALVVFNQTDETLDTLPDTINKFSDKIVSEMNSIVSETADESAPPVALDKGAETSSNKSQSDIPGIYKGLIQSDRIEAEILSIAVGDVDGDGSDEFIMIDKKRLYKAKLVDGEITIEAVLDLKQFLKPFSVDLYDMDNDAKDEIFVSATHRYSGSVQSYVYSWKNGKIETVSEKEKWFFAVKPCGSGGQPILTGQKKDFGHELFHESIYELALNREKGEFVWQKKLETYEGANVYSFTCGDLMNSGTSQVVGFVTGDYIAAFENPKKRLWLSDSRYGGSVRFIETNNNGTLKRTYLQTRLHIENIDDDAESELLTIVNENSTPRALVNLKNFRKGRILCLVMRGLNVEKKWQTQAVTGYIPDFGVTANADGTKKALVYVVVTKTGVVLKKKESYIVVQPVNK